MYFLQVWKIFGKILQFDLVRSHISHHVLLNLLNELQKHLISLYAVDQLLSSELHKNKLSF